MSDVIGNLLAEILQIKAGEIKDDLRMKDIDTWDSLKHMEVIASLEQAFGVEFTFEEIVAMQSVKVIRKTLKEKGVNN